MESAGRAPERSTYRCVKPKNIKVFFQFKVYYRGFPGDTVVKHPPANAGDMGLSPGPGRSYMPRSN